jgi:putative endonuclease
VRNNKNKGDWGEKVALEFLQKKGFSILETNWCFLKLEIDIIAKHEGKIVFVEVKTRFNEEKGDPEDGVTLKKQRFLIKAANYYIIEKDIMEEARFDIVSVLTENNKTQVKHYPDAFYPIAK